MPRYCSPSPVDRSGEWKIDIDLLIDSGRKRSSNAGGFRMRLPPTLGRRLSAETGKSMLVLRKGSVEGLLVVGNYTRTKQEPLFTYFATSRNLGLE